MADEDLPRHAVEDLERAEALLCGRETYEMINGRSMVVFGWLKSVPFSDPVLGEFRRRGGALRGEIAVGDVRAPLALPGSRAAPDAQALDIARSLPADYPGWRRVIEAPLFEHSAPYAEAVAAGEAEPSEQGVPRTSQPERVWPHASVAFVAVISLEGELAVEIG